MCHPDRSFKPGGCEPVAACHAAAAPRWATRRDTAAPTPNEIDQMSASRQPTPRDAGFSGGSWWRLTRQSAVMPLRHAAAAAAPDANATISQRRRCTPNSFPAGASGNPCNARRSSKFPPPGSTDEARRPEYGKVDFDLVRGAVACETAAPNRLSQMTGLPLSSTLSAGMPE